jgi:pimeloyl-ACP methyl ester carboxylesterase
MHGPGISGEAFRFQRDVPARIETPAWLPHERGEPLEVYAKRMADTIDPTPPLYIGGVSFGGMVALEAARYLNPRAVLLIASGYSGAHTHAILHHILQPATAHLPLWLFHLSRPILPAILRLAYITAPKQSRDLIVELFQHHCDFDNWRRGIAAISYWKFRGKLDMPVYHIHGHNDWLMPLDRVAPHAVVPGGPHLMNITHPEPVNEFLIDRLTRYRSV